jgi:diguanylate cyclase (GGDEF)-like protein/PAS domain S-box-containing protein
MNPRHDKDAASDAGHGTVEDQFRAVVANVPGAVYRRDCTEPWTIRYISDYVEVLTGFPPGEFAGDSVRSFTSLIHPDDKEHAAAQIAKALQGEGSFEIEYRVMHVDGSTRWVAERGRCIPDQAGAPTWIDGVILDMTEQKQAERARRRAETELRRVVDDIPGIVYRSECRDPWGIHFISDHVESMLGYAASDFLEGGTVSFGQLLHPDDCDLIDRTIEEVLERGTSYFLEYRLIHADGSIRSVSEHGRVVRDATGTPVWLDGVILDTTKQKLAEEARDRAEAELRHQALHDALTGLPNRTLVLDRAEQMLLRCRRGSAMPAAMFIDLDNFKAVNDGMGHQVGDELLGAVAHRLAGALRAGETIGRLGGDEFVILTEVGSDDPRPERIADRLLDVLAEPFELAGHFGAPLTISASIGIATGNRATAQELLRDADIALYRAKETGKHCHIAFEPQMRVDIIDRMDMEIDLRSALEKHEYFLAYQPVVDLVTGNISGVEALVRWRHPTRGVVGPTDFVPMLEQTGMIIPVGRWILGEACREAATWLAHGHRVEIAVNVSGRQLETEGFVDDVRAVLLASRIDPDLLTLEVTESTLMRDTELIASRLRTLKGLGVRIAIDDFGTGYSSLSYLRQFPIDTLKIDQSFVAALDDSPESLAFIRTFVELGQLLGIETLAEGIETRGHLEALQGAQCGKGQGFWLSTPVSGATIRSYLEGGSRHADGVEASREQLI